ncbi:MAG: glycosyltransferase, partial [bacterium]
VGTILDKVSEQKVEMLLKSMQHCLEFIPAVQLIIIGEFTDKKKLDWLIKKINVPNVWLISDQINLKKWLNNFDVFVIAEAKPSINNILAAMGAMANKLVVIGQKGSCLDDIIVDQQTGLLIELNSENLAEQIVELQQNTVQRKIFGKRAWALSEEYFSFSRSADDFYKLLTNIQTIK